VFKKARFNFIAVGLMALLTAFNTSRQVAYKYHRQGSLFTIGGVQYVAVVDLTYSEDIYDCVLTTPNTECTFESTERAQLRVRTQHVLSITKTAWDKRTNIESGEIQFW